jgi:hypothetical protein
LIPIPRQAFYGSRGARTTGLVLCIVGVVATKQMAAVRSWSFWVAVAIFWCYALIDPTPAFHTLHYDAYVAPLHLLRHGGIPFVDVYSQYGLSFLAYLPVGTVLPYTYESAALVTRAFNVATIILALAVIYRLVGDRPFAFATGVLFVPFTWLAMPYNLDFTPSIFGVRWLPVWLLVLCLTPTFKSRPPYRHGWGAIAALNFCGLWSVETFIVAGAIFGFYIGLTSRLAGKSVARSTLVAIAASSWLLVGQLALALLILISTGRFISYVPYLEMVSAYGVGQNVTWMYLAKAEIATNIWLLFVIIYGVLLLLAFATFLSGSDLVSSRRLLLGLSVLAACGAAQGLYYVGRPTQPMLAVSALPLYVILCCCLVLLLFRVWKAPPSLDRTIALSACLAPLCVGLGYAWDRASAPLTNRLMGPNNSTLLLRCLQAGECNPLRQFSVLAQAVRGDGAVPLHEAEVRRQGHSIAELFRKWRDSAPAVAVIAPQRTTALVLVDAEDSLRANNLENSYLSARLVDEMRRRLANLPAESLVLTSNNPTSYELDLLCHLAKTKKLEQIDAGYGTDVFRMASADQDFAIGQQLEHVGGQTFIPARNGRKIRVAAGALAGFVEELRVEDGKVTIGGWAVDLAIKQVPPAIVMTLNDQIWLVAAPSSEGKEIGSIDPGFVRGGFKHFGCQVNEEDLGTFRAYAISTDGIASELRYRIGVPNGTGKKG